MPLQNLKLISAGAGSGKTYRLTQEMTQLLVSGAARPDGIIATTFTKRAAAELKERVRVELLRKGMTAEANALTNALVGTVHGLGVKLLRRFAFEAGVSPRVDILADGDDQRLFNLSMAAVIDLDTIGEIELLCDKLGLSLNGEKYNWRRDVRDIVEVIRGNNFDAATIQRSKTLSWETLKPFLPPAGTITLEQFHTRLRIALTETVAALRNNEADGTKKTATAAQSLRTLLGELDRRGYLPWFQYATLGKFDTKVGAKSRELVEGIVELGQQHAGLAAFQQDIKRYQDLCFDCAAAAIAEYDRYKKARGRIDYTDMEVLVLKLLDEPAVQAALRRELDLLMVDEFQDTSPIQLAIFLRLSELAKQSVWVGDPKQSIYGFRGAEPRLMRAVMEANGPVDPANIQTRSWRSREDVVYACNSLFVNAFPDLPPEAVALDPVRRRQGSQYAPAESPELAEKAGLWHWHFELEGKGRYSAAWLQEVTAKAVKELLANPPRIRPKGASAERPLRPGDIAILCRSNYGCRAVAEALNKQGLPAAIASDGLLGTAEATLLLACLKYLLSGSDSLSVAEITLFGARYSLADIIASRLDHLQAKRQYEERRANGPTENKDDEENPPEKWEANNPFVRQLDQLRSQIGEHSTSETLNLLLERLDLRRAIVAWGNGEQRLSNVDELRRLAVAYEDNCHRQHRAASLGGFLLYLNQLVRERADNQGASERPDAVNVLTYHKSKGLEWPAVVCFNLDQALRAEVWGRTIVAETEEVDLAAPLAHRWLRYWVNPYARVTTGIPWVDALNESTVKVAAEEEAKAEEARLLYVGMTRARDFLILPTGKPGAPWVDRVYARGGTATTVLEPHTSETPFSWDGRDIDKYTQTWTEERNLPASEMSYGEIPFIAGLRRGRSTEYAALQVDDKWLVNTYGSPKVGADHRYFQPGEPDPETDNRILAEALARFLSGDYPGTRDRAFRLERAEELLDAYRPGGQIEPIALVEQATAFAEHWPQGKRFQNVYRQVPIRTVVDKRQYARRLDWLLLTTDDELIVIDDLFMNRKQLDKQIALRAAELKLQCQAAEARLKKRVTGAYLHLVGDGLLVEISR